MRTKLLECDRDAISKLRDMAFKRIDPKEVVSAHDEGKNEELLNKAKRLVKLKKLFLAIIYHL